MAVVAVSFTSESCDHYLSLFTDIEGPEDLVERLKEEYGDEFAFMSRWQLVADEDTDELEQALRQALEEATEEQY